MRALLLFMNAGLLLLAIVSLMIFFTGGSGGRATIVLLLMLGAPFSAACVLTVVALGVKKTGWAAMKAEILGNIPNWLKFAIALLLALLFCGELALLLAYHLGAADAPRFMYLPIVTGTLANLAFALVYARR